MAENKAKCFDCGATVTRLIREYNVRASSSNDKNYFIGRFVTGLPDFSKKKSAENKWSLQKDGLQSRQVTDALREKYKNKPWLLEDETGQSQYQGHLEGAQSATYYLLMMERKEFVAIPAGSWYNFNKVAQYKQLTLEEAEEKMKNRKKTADGYERWMMKAANNGPAAFGERNVKFDEKESNVAGGKSRKKTGDDDEGHASDKGEEDEEEEAARKTRLGLNKRGDDWEHEEIFTDDDEAVGNDPEEREDLAPEVPAPPEIKQMDDEVGAPPVLASKQKDAPKEEPADNSPLKPTATGTARGTSSTSKSSKGKRKLNEETKASNGAPPKKVKTENEPKLSVKDENGSASKSNAPPKGTPAPSSKAGSSTTASGPVSEEEIRAVLMQKTPVTTQDLVAKFKARLRSSEDKKAFAEILKRISKIQKTANGSSYVILRDR
ncbi:Winged helix-like DNA-binding domain superfamily [Sesbania bispinosa]|nr:Winged helix-like DNA-binding domain superfamily [Sesbania bispinosa]